MAEQSYQIPVFLDAALSEGYEDAFASASKLAADLKKQSSALEKELNALGKEADSFDKLGESSDKLRKDMGKLEKQIDETRKATDKFGNAKKHFRNAKIGAAALKNEIGDLLGMASKAALGVAAVGTAAAVALSPSEETLAFGDQTARLEILPEMDPIRFDRIKKQLLELSTLHVDIELPELTAQFNKLRKRFSLDEAETLLPSVAAFQTITGNSITSDFMVDHDAIVAALNVTTADQYKLLLETLAKGVTLGNLNLENIDAGDLGTLVEAYGSDLRNRELQEALLIALKHKELDSEQFADKFREFLTRFDMATFIPEIDLTAPIAEQKVIIKQQAEAQANRETFAKWGLDEGSTLIDLAKNYMKLGEEARKELVHDLDPLLGGSVIDVLLSAPQGLEQIIEDASIAVSADTNMAEQADKILNTWSKVWRRIGTTWTNTMNPLQEEFARTFGPSIVAVFEKLFDFIYSHKAEIGAFFGDVHDKLTPIILKIWGVIRDAWPDIRGFAVEVWSELSDQWANIAPIGKQFAEMLWSIVKPVVDFVREHPKLVATLITGIAIWKAYRLAVGGAQVVYDLVAGSVNLVQGHLHKLTATAIGNQRALANTGEAALSTGQKFANMTKNVLATKFPRFAGVIGGIKQIGISALASLPGIGAMGAGLWTALAPLLPVIAVVAAAIGVVAGLAYLVYRNWETLKPFFSELWGTIKLGAEIAWEFVKFIALSALVGLKTAWEGVTGFFSGIWEGVRGIFLDSPLAPVFQFLIDGVKAVVSPILDFFSGVWSAVTDMAAGAFDWIIAKFRGLNDFLDGIFGWLKGKNRELSDELKGIRAENVIEYRQNVTGMRESRGAGERGGELENTLPQVSVLPAGVSPVFDSPDVITPAQLETAPTGMVNVESPAVNVTAPSVEMPSGVAPVFDSPVGSERLTESDRLSETVKMVESPSVNVESPVVNVEAAPLNVAAPVVEMPSGVAPVFDAPDVITPRAIETNTVVTETMQIPTGAERVEYQDLRDVEAERSQETGQGTAQISIDDLPTIDTPPSVDVPSSPAAGQSVENEGDRSVSQVNYFTINQQPGEDGDALAKRIAEILKQQMNDAPSRFLTQ